MSVLLVGAGFMAFCGVVGSTLDVEGGAAIGIWFALTLLTLAEIAIYKELKNGSK